MKKLCKIFTIAIVSLFIILFFSKNVNAADTSITGIMNGGDFFVSSGKNENIFNDKAVKSGTSQLYFICLGVGIFAAVIGGIILGIQFVTTGVSGQAKVKEKFLPYVIGCVVVFGGFGIWKAVINIGQNVMDENVVGQYSKITIVNNNRTYSTEGDSITISVQIDDMDSNDYSIVGMEFDLSFGDDAGNYVFKNMKIDNKYEPKTQENLDVLVNYTTNKFQIVSKNGKSIKLYNGMEILNVSYQIPKNNCAGNNVEIKLTNLSIYDSKGNDISNKFKVENSNFKVDKPPERDKDGSGHVSSGRKR